VFLIATTNKEIQVNDPIRLRVKSIRNPYGYTVGYHIGTRRASYCAEFRRAIGVTKERARRGFDLCISRTEPQTTRTFEANVWLVQNSRRRSIYTYRLRRVPDGCGFIIDDARSFRYRPFPLPEGHGLNTGDIIYQWNECT
jgi:hypothetical protein